MDYGDLFNELLYKLGIASLLLAIAFVGLVAAFPEVLLSYAG